MFFCVWGGEVWSKREKERKRGEVGFFKSLEATEGGKKERRFEKKRIAHDVKSPNPCLRLFFSR